MSIITSRSHVMSILKTSNPVAMNSLHKVRFHLPSNIKKIFEDYKNNYSSKEYEELICTIRDSEISDRDLLALLEEAKKSITILNYDLRLFVQALSIIKWTHREEEVVKSYQEFINELVSAHSQHNKVVINHFIMLFLNTEATEWSNCEPNEVQKKQFENIHMILKSVLETIPMCEDVLVERIKQNFPYFSRNVITQQSYMYNILKIISYQPHLRAKILEIIVDKLLLRDVHAPRDDVIQAEEKENDFMEISKDPPLENHMKHPVANALDKMIELLFKFIRNECYEGDKLIQVKCHKLYKELLCIFENTILPVHATHHIQFIMFYICSFEKSLVHQFLRYLWTKAISPNLQPVIRQTCVAYLSSFLARADYILLWYLKDYLSKMNKWIHNYISNYCKTSYSVSDYNDHSVFYSVCQAFFYLIAFRHEDLVDSRTKLAFLQNLNLSKIVTCKLNPLRTCLPDVVSNFAAVTRVHQLAYCYTIIENNMRNNLPIVDKDGTIKINAIIEMYFPFDPYILQRSYSYIKPLYREYNPVIDEISENEDIKNKQHSQSPFYMKGFSPVSISRDESFENNLFK